MSDWDKINEQYASNFVEYAPDGNHKVKVEKVNIHEVGQNGAVAMDFLFEEGDYKYPKATHWMTFKPGKDNWRKYHTKQLLVVLGLPEETAEKSVDNAEAKEVKDAMIKVYQATFDKLLARKPEVEIEVWKDGKYSTAEFTDNRVRMSRPEDTESDPLEKAVEELSGTELSSEELDALPF